MHLRLSGEYQIIFCRVFCKQTYNENFQNGDQNCYGYGLVCLDDSCFAGIACNTRWLWGCRSNSGCHFEVLQSSESGIFTIICFQQYLLIQQGLKWRIYSGSYSKTKVNPGLFHYCPISMGKIPFEIRPTLVLLELVKLLKLGFSRKYYGLITIYRVFLQMKWYVSLKNKYINKCNFL